MATKASKEVLYESMHQADLEYKRAQAHGFEQHASQVKTDEGDEKAVPSWRKEQLEQRKEEENEDLAELAVVAPKQYKRKMARSKQQLQKKEDIYAIIKMAEQGEDVLDGLLVSGNLPGVSGDRSDTDDDDAEEEGGDEVMEGFGGDSSLQMEPARSAQVARRWRIPLDEARALCSAVDAQQSRTWRPRRRRVICAHEKTTAATTAAKAAHPASDRPRPSPRHTQDAEPLWLAALPAGSRSSVDSLELGVDALAAPGAAYHVASATSVHGDHDHDDGEASAPRTRSAGSAVANEDDDVIYGGRGSMDDVAGAHDGYLTLRASVHDGVVPLASDDGDEVDEDPYTYAPLQTCTLAGAGCDPYLASDGCTSSSADCDVYIDSASRGNAAGTGKEKVANPTGADNDALGNTGTGNGNGLFVVPAVNRLASEHSVYGEADLDRGATVYLATGGNTNGNAAGQRDAEHARPPPWQAPPRFSRVSGTTQRRSTPSVHTMALFKNNSSALAAVDAPASTCASAPARAAGSCHLATDNSMAAAAAATPADAAAATQVLPGPEEPAAHDGGAAEGAHGEHGAQDVHDARDAHTARDAHDANFELCASPAGAEKFMAIHDFTGTDGPRGGMGPGPFAMRAGDTIWVTSRHGNTGWWRGHAHGMVGLFPASYVRPFMAPDPAARYVALRGFDGGSVEGGVTMAQGDLVTVVCSDEVAPGWWSGSVAGAKGIFPATLVSLVTGGCNHGYARRGDHRDGAAGMHNVMTELRRLLR